MKLNCFVNIISKFFKRTFACYSLITISISLFGMLMNTDDFFKYLSVNQLLTFLVFSLLFSLSFAIADLLRFNVVLKRCCQFILTYLSLAVVFFMGGNFANYVEINNVQNKGFSILAISFAFVIIYAICATIALIFGFVKNRMMNSNKQYDSIFEKDE